MARDSSPSDAGSVATDGAPLRVGIIGFGLAGTVFHAPLISSTPGMIVAAIVTSDPSRQARASAEYPAATIYSTADEMLADPSKLDLVVVATTNRVHVPLGIAALEAGLPVVVDKPMSPSSAEGVRLIGAAKAAGKLLSVFQNRRWDSDFLTVRRLIDRGMLGSVVRFESRFERFRPEVRPDAWRERPAPEEGGGLLFDLGAHLIDQACVLFGPPTLVYAESEARRPGAQVDDDTFVALRFAGGQIAHLWASVIPHQPGPRLRVVGTQGVFTTDELDPQEEALRTGSRPGDEQWGMPPREHWGRLSADVEGVWLDSAVRPARGSYGSYYAGMRDALVAGAPLPVDPMDSLRVLRVIEVARRAAQAGEILRLTPDGQAHDEPAQ